MSLAEGSVLLDTNVLVTATVPARGLHAQARAVLDAWPNSGVRLCTSGQILREYLVVATRPIEVNGLDLGLEDALANVVALRGRMRLLEERVAVFERLEMLIESFDCKGKEIHDANIVATALVHGVGRLLTANAGDFRRYADLLSIEDLASV